MEADPTQAHNQDDATGFIRLNGLEAQGSRSGASGSETSQEATFRSQKQRNAQG